MSVLAVDVHNLVKSFGNKKVVDNVSLQVGKGEIYGFLGPNGSGKTTCIRLMCGLLTPDSGTGTCLGYDIVRQREIIKENIGYMTQRFSFWEDLTIRENLEFIARLYDMPRKKEVVDSALENLNLTDRSAQITGALSGGWKQRLALAACMMHNPSLLLLDEPTAGVDPAARRDFWDELHKLADSGISVLVSTHYMDEAERCHKLAYIAYGKLMASGTAEEITASQKIFTLAVTGKNLIALENRLKSIPGIEQTVIFGNSLHVSGLDEAFLHDAVSRCVRDGTVTPVKTGLEDVFIYMMKHSLDSVGTGHEKK